MNNNSSNAFINYKKQKGYLTGDLGYIQNNKIYCVGRKDTQIKYKGYRIELSEIENVINDIYYVEKAVVTTRKNNDNKVSRIIAFVKIKKSYNKMSKDIKVQLQKVLPEYMIPTVKIITEIPLTQNGKIDIKKLLEKKV